MQNIGLISGAVQLIVSLLAGLSVAYVSFRAFRWLHRDLDPVKALKDHNVAMAIVLASMVVGTGLVVLQALEPVVSTLQTTLYDGVTFWSGLAFLGLALGHLALVLFIAIVGITFATSVFTRLTPNIREFDEIKDKNVAVAITLAAVILLMSMFLAHGSQIFLSSLVPYPAMEPIQIMGE
ncbi:MAG: DUF350 domain-containing protein [Planctomycetes bacterium]|nr:DUF350 domain-containing protein [Planctomycetota bacterium]